MTTHTKRRRRVTKKVLPTRHLTAIESKTIAFVSTLILASIAVIQGINDPVVWAFLGTAIGITLGQNNNNV